MRDKIVNSFESGFSLLQGFIEDRNNIDVVTEVAHKIASVFKSGGKVVIFGNGGSATDAMHFAEEFTGRFRGDRRPLPAISLTDSSHITCVGNDYGFSEIFSRGVEAYCTKGDFVIGISTSGNSENVIKGLEKAEALNCSTFSLLGKDGGKLKNKCSYEIIIPGVTSDRVQELHMMVLHIIIEGVERELFPENYK